MTLPDRDDSDAAAWERYAGKARLIGWSEREIAQARPGWQARRDWQRREAARASGESNAEAWARFAAPQARETDAEAWERVAGHLRAHGWKPPQVERYQLEWQAAMERSRADAADAAQREEAEAAEAERREEKRKRREEERERKAQAKAAKAARIAERQWRIWQTRQAWEEREREARKVSDLALKAEGVPQVEAGDFRVTVKVRNARLLRAIEGAGFASVVKFAQAISEQPGMIYNYIGLIRAPLTKQGKPRPDIARIALALGAEIEELFPPDYMTRVLARNAVTVEMTSEAIGEMISATREPDAALIGEEALSMIAGALDTLEPADRRCLELRFGLNGEREHTLAEVAEMFGVTRERIRQRERRAIDRLRSPKRIGMARHAWDLLELGVPDAEAPKWREE